MSETKKINQAKLKRAKDIDKKFKNLRISFRAHWVIYGKLAQEFEEQEMFQLMGFGSMKQYLKSLENASYSTIAEALAVRKAFANLSDEELAGFPKENLKILAKLPESKRYNPKLLEFAKACKARDLRVKVNAKYKTALEGKTRIFFDVETSAIDPINTVIDQIVETVSCSRGYALELLCVQILTGKQDIYVPTEAERDSLRSETKTQLADRTKRAINLE